MSLWLFKLYVHSSDEGENGNMKEGSEIFRGGERGGITWPLVVSRK